MTLMAGHCADVREAASYAPKEPMPMSNEEAIQVLGWLSKEWIPLTSKDAQEALNLADAALRAQSEPGPQRNHDADIERLTKQRDASETQRCEWVRTARAAERRAELLERALRLALDAIDETGAGL